MTTQRKIEILGAVLTLLLVVCFVRAWVLERESRIRAEVTAKAGDQIIAAKDAAIKGRDATDLQYSAALSRQAAAVQTAPQAAQVILRYLPTPAPSPGEPTPAPQTITTVTRDQLTPTEQASLPSSPTYGILTEFQMKAVAQHDLECDATSHSLTTCQADKTDLQAEVVAEKKTSAAWETAAKGGTKLQRIFKVAKYVGCAAGGGYVGSLASKSSPAIGAGVGAAAGVTACSLF